MLSDREQMIDLSKRTPQELENLLANNQKHGHVLSPHSIKAKLTIWLISRVSVIPRLRKCSFGNKWWRSSALRCAFVTGSSSSEIFCLENKTRASSEGWSLLFANNWQTAAATQNARYGIVVGTACEQEPTCIVTRVVRVKALTQAAS
jgi:hypothetical protein